MSKRLKKYATIKTYNHSGQKITGANKPRRAWGPKTLRILQHDIDKRLFHSLAKQDTLSTDTETDGLDWAIHKLRTIQLCTPDRRCYIIREPNLESHWLQALLTHSYATKIFHHGLFDLRFLKRWLGIDVTGQIECTKILMKFIHPGVKTGLASMVKSRYKVKLPYISDYNWDGKLTAKQKEYVVGDVLYLHRLVKDLKKEATHGQLARYPMAIHAMREKAILEVEGYEDVLDYPSAKKERIDAVRYDWARIKYKISGLREMLNPE